ncbi:XrtA/PEP-CTERM system-associated ATPase [Sphingomonas sp. LT1P40]|uniref:XrtA/PEP-CTERM system-associated ATPase n=1 Tax=Alteristakelama amylovorans TaxID=3096166 RepID=UPI002FC90E6A
MYDDHYGLSGRPFQLTPDPAFWFDTTTHRKAMAYLGYGLSQGEGFIVITGDPGAGKTTLVGHLMETIDRERLNVIKIVTTQIEAEDLLHMVAAGLGVDSAGMAKAQMLAGIEKGLHATARDGKRTLLIVDEAQALPIASLEELRMLSNFQAGGYPLLQIFLLGQPEFRSRLADPKLEQLRQRVIAMHQLDPMGAEELEPYLIHRLSVVGWRGRPRFTNDAVAAIHRWSGGVPRKVNQLAGRVLLFGAIEQIDSFSGADVEAVIADLDNDTMVAGRPVAAAAAFEAAAAPVVAEVKPVTEGDLGARIGRLEARLEEQDAALRRVLTLMVDFIEAEEGKHAIRRGTAA